MGDLSKPTDFELQKFELPEFHSLIPFVPPSATSQSLTESLTNEEHFPDDQNEQNGNFVHYQQNNVGSGSEIGESPDAIRNPPSMVPMSTEISETPDGLSVNNTLPAPMNNAAYQKFLYENRGNVLPKPTVSVKLPSQANEDLIPRLDGTDSRSRHASLVPYSVSPGAHKSASHLGQVGNDLRAVYNPDEEVGGTLGDRHITNSSDYVLEETGYNAGNSVADRSLFPPVRHPLKLGEEQAQYYDQVADEGDEKAAAAAPTPGGDVNLPATPNPNGQEINEYDDVYYETTPEKCETNGDIPCDTKKAARKQKGANTAAATPKEQVEGSRHNLARADTTFSKMNSSKLRNRLGQRLENRRTRFPGRGPRSTRRPLLATLQTSAFGLFSFADTDEISTRTMTTVTAAPIALMTTRTLLSARKNQPLNMSAVNATKNTGQEGASQFVEVDGERQPMIPSPPALSMLEDRLSKDDNGDDNSKLQDPSTFTTRLYKPILPNELTTPTPIEDTLAYPPSSTNARFKTFTNINRDGILKSKKVSGQTVESNSDPKRTVRLQPQIRRNTNITKRTNYTTDLREQLRRLVRRLRKNKNFNRNNQNATRLPVA